MPGRAAAARASMNRTANRRLLAVTAALLGGVVLAPAAAGQEPVAKPQESVAASLVAALQESEARVRTVRLELETSGRLDGGLSFTTRGTLRVLRAEQGGATAMHSLVEFEFADGLGGSMESLATKDGIVVLQQDPTFGEVCVRIDASVVADLEWAGTVLQKTDLPFQPDARGRAPLGSAMLADLARRFDLKASDKKDEALRKGRWFAGDRKKTEKLEDDGEDLPVSDRIEVFVRDADHALLDVVHFRSGEVVQRIHAVELVLDEEMKVESFRMRDPAKKPRDVREHAPMWQQIEQVLKRATAKSNGELPPSRR